MEIGNSPIRARLAQMSLNCRLPALSSRRSEFLVGGWRIVNKFDKPQRMRFATWCRTQELSGEKGSDLQIYVHVFYDDGTRGTFRLPLPTGTHDWQLVESFFTLEKEVNPDQTPMLYVNMSRKSGTVWLDDLYLGPAAGN